MSTTASIEVTMRLRKQDEPLYHYLFHDFTDARLREKHREQVRFIRQMATNATHMTDNELILVEGAEYLAKLIEEELQSRSKKL